MATTKFESLPYDLLFQVVYLLSVADILRLRQVSQKFRRLTYEKTVWANAYRKSSILRPPGPFPSQSSAHLEYELKKCMKLHANWTTKSPRPVSRRTLNLDSNAKAITMTLALGRYLLVLGRQFLKCYDLDSSAEEHISRPIASYDLPAFDYCYDPIVDTSMDERERTDGSQMSIICALLFPTEQEMKVILLDLHILHDTVRFELRNEVLVPYAPRHDPGSLMGNFLLVGDDDPTVLHIPTCQLYYLPPSGPRGDKSCFLTSTHLLVLTPYEVVAFLLPDGVQESSETNAQQRAVLTRSHIHFHPFTTGPALFLSSHTTYTHFSSKKNQHGQWLSSEIMTFLCQAPVEGGRELRLVDIELLFASEGVGYMGTRVTPGPGLDKNMFIGRFLTGTMQRGCARIITTTGGHANSLAITVNFGEGDRSIMVSDLDIEEGDLAWDGLRERLCRLVSQTCIEIHDYV